MPESGSSGSVGEPPGNRRLYPDRAKLSLGEGDGAAVFETSHRNPVGSQSRPAKVSHRPEASLA